MCSAATFLCATAAPNPSSRESGDHLDLQVPNHTADPCSETHNTRLNNPTLKPPTPHLNLIVTADPPHCEACGPKTENCPA